MNLSLPFLPPTLAFSPWPIVQGIVMTLFLLVGLLLLAVILIQEGKGGGVAGAFGGAVGDTFGVKAGTINRFTAVLATIFVGLALIHASIGSHLNRPKFETPPPPPPAPAPAEPGLAPVPPTTPAMEGTTPPTPPAPAMEPTPPAPAMEGATPPAPAMEPTPPAPAMDAGMDEKPPEPAPATPTPDTPVPPK